MDLSLAKLQQLVTVARTGNISRAAVELNISQPALSRSIAAIESRYGFKIFNRTAHGIELTAAGAQVIKLSEPVLQKIRVLDNDLKLFGSGKKGSVAIGLAPLLASQTLAEFSSSFFNEDTSIQLETMIRSGATLVEGLKNDQIETFFFPEGYIEPDPEVDTEVVGTIQPVCVVRKHHPLASKRKLTLEHLAEYPWASSIAPAVIQQEVSPTQFICDNYHILLETVLKSNLICICSWGFAEQQLESGELREIKVTGLPLPIINIYAATLTGRVRSPLTENAIERMRSILNITH